MLCHEVSLTSILNNNDRTLFLKVKPCIVSQEQNMNKIQQKQNYTKKNSALFFHAEENMCDSYHEIRIMV